MLGLDTLKWAWCEFMGSFARPNKRQKTADGTTGEIPAESGHQVWIPALITRLASFLPHNDRECLRFVNRAAQAALPGPMALKPSEPVPRWAMARLLPDSASTDGLTAAAVEIGPRIMEAPAGAGQLAACRWLLGHVREMAVEDWSAVLRAAAPGGHRHVCEWVLELTHDMVCRRAAVKAAFKHGHADLAFWLLQPVDFQTYDYTGAFMMGMLGSSARLDEVQSLADKHLPEDWVGEIPADCIRLLKAALLSDCDWKAKAEWVVDLFDEETWLEIDADMEHFGEGPQGGKGLRIVEWAVAAPHDDWLERVVNVAAARALRCWQVQGKAFIGAAASGDVAEMRSPALDPKPGAWAAAVGSGCVAAVQTLVDMGCPAPQEDEMIQLVTAAARDVKFRELFQPVPGLGAPFPSGLFALAVTANARPALLRWLLDLGCPMDGTAWTAAAGIQKAGPGMPKAAVRMQQAAVSAVAALCELRCPLPAHGEPYDAFFQWVNVNGPAWAWNWKLMLPLLWDAGMGFGRRGGDLLTEAVQAKLPRGAVRWFLERGCTPSAETWAAVAAHPD
ncbi:hypothetical protein HYH03_011068 [Edaphochlamys debaryana]|uniref:Ankyrin repeat domain-containing protein n=1 Tax=Edaphochlamys debaryana TaxID=47281 RepID=A0A835XVM9_9CHLO|nr:hypothetical protein HYH03_011068 [Edaphochlamys debaryana]|eukprot:KAG2490432.1 hypothetical protein HYH03_011068 [Edaphochlamys debaryana]